MSAPDSLLKRLGGWSGPSRLWLPPETVARESTSFATLACAAKETIVSLAYTWAFDGEPLEGLLLLNRNTERQDFQAVWIDSWHMSAMNCHGAYSNS